MENITPIQQAGIVLYKGDFDVDSIMGALAIMHPVDFLKLTGNEPSQLAAKTLRDNNTESLKGITRLEYNQAYDCVVVIEGLLRLDKYVESIKYLRGMTALSLKEAKNFVCTLRETVATPNA